jgi:hypothetical protein
MNANRVNWLGTALLFLGLTVSRAPAQQGTTGSPATLQGKAVDAYVYGYPLVLMSVTRSVQTNAPAPDPTHGVAPINQFVSAPAFASPDSKVGARPNADTLYSLAWLDLSKEPIMLHVPATPGRYYLMEILDAWTNVIGDPGTRTTGSGEQTFAIMGPDIRVKFQEGVIPISMPTNTAWILGRTQTNGPADYAAVHAIQAQYTLTPLSAWGTNYTPPTNMPLDPTVDESTPPAQQVAQMDAATFFGTLAQQMKSNPPAPEDAPILQELAALGIVPGQAFTLSSQAAAVVQALTDAMKLGPARIQARAQNLGTLINGWRVLDQGIGTYGTDYDTRAAVAMLGVGANLPADAIYPSAQVDTAGNPLSGANTYVIHFAAGQAPPVNAFWSITMYDDQGYFVANPINRYALHNWDPLTYNADGSLDLYLQNQSPGADKEANWLPTPEGVFNLTMRLYWPKPEALNGSWQPSAIRRAQ